MFIESICTEKKGKLSQMYQFIKTILLMTSLYIVYGINLFVPF